MIKFNVLLAAMLVTFATQAQKTKTENVVLITLDGMRWQEVFNGADSAFMRQQQYLKDPKSKNKFWRNDVAGRRKALFPFLWGTVAEKGQLYGNRNVGSKMNVTNNQWFSYPGYNEILTGAADNERITVMISSSIQTQTYLSSYRDNRDFRKKLLHTLPGMSSLISSTTRETASS
jgi:hypothetical protein